MQQNKPVNVLIVLVFFKGPQGEPGPPGQQGTPGTQVNNESITNQSQMHKIIVKYVKY